MAGDVYAMHGSARARELVDHYKTRARELLGKHNKGKIETGIGTARTVLEVAGASYIASRVSAQYGGPDGKAVMGIPLELLIGGACAVAYASGYAGEHGEDVLAVGMGAVAAYSARLGYTSGLQHARPPASVQGYVGAYPQSYGLAPMPVPYALPLPSYPPPPLPSYATPAPGYAIPQVPASTYVAVPDPEGSGETETEVGAGTFEAAAQVLDQFNAR